VFEICFAALVRQHLRALRRFAQVQVLDAVTRYLADQPPAESGHRRRLRQNLLPPWELRVGSVRVCRLRRVDVER
jgi:hypothetical protein